MTMTRKRQKTALKNIVIVMGSPKFQTVSNCTTREELSGINAMPISAVRRVTSRLGGICQKFFQKEYITKSILKFHMFFGDTNFLKTETSVEA